MEPCALQITFWGVTGSLPRPLAPDEVTDKVVRSLAEILRVGDLGELLMEPRDEGWLRRFVERTVPRHLHSTYGGNTTCLEIQAGEQLFIVDAGSGLRELGASLVQRWNAPGYAGPRRGHLLLTHAHLDHTLATPFFDPFYDPRNQFSILGPAAALASLEHLFGPGAEFRGIYHPASLDDLRAIDERQAIGAGQTLSIGDTQVRSYALCHPGGALAYRFDRAGRSVVIATDHEQQAEVDLPLADFARGADLLYADAQYLADEYHGYAGPPGEAPQSRRGWGHTAVERCVATAVAAGVRRLCLGHREPRRGDVGLAHVEALARRALHDALRSAGRAPHDCELLLPRERQTVQIV